MKKSIKSAFCGILCLIGSVSFFYASSPDSDVYEDLFLYAKNLQEGGAAEQAEVEYKRYIFMQEYSAGIHQAEAFEQLAELYAANEKWELAAQTIQKAILSSIDYNEPEEKTDYLRQKHIFYLTQNARQNKTQLSQNLFVFSYINLPDFSDTVKQTAMRANFQNLIQLELWETAKKEFEAGLQAYPQLFTEYEAAVIRKNLDKINTFKPKNQILAGYLSFIPGLGQLYAGDYKDSLNAFLLNGSLIAISAYSLVNLDFWTFSLLEFNLLTHFMKGNIYNAQKDAYMYNTSRIGAYSKEITDLFGILE